MRPTVLLQSTPDNTNPAWLTHRQANSRFQALLMRDGVVHSGSSCSDWKYVVDRNNSIACLLLAINFGYSLLAGAGGAHAPVRSEVPRH